MKFCSKCGKEIVDEAIVCPHCGCAIVDPPNAIIPNNDQVSIGLCIIAALIPLFGFIYWPVAHKSTPKRARACGITAIVAWAIYFLFNFIIGFIGALL